MCPSLSEFPPVDSIQLNKKMKVNVRQGLYFHSAHCRLLVQPLPNFCSAWCTWAGAISRAGPVSCRTWQIACLVSWAVWHSSTPYAHWLCLLPVLHLTFPDLFQEWRQCLLFMASAQSAKMEISPIKITQACKFLDKFWEGHFLYQAVSPWKH